MNQVQLLLVLHGHQPVGEPDEAVAQAHAKHYRPLLDALLAHPGLRCSLHLSGALLEWLEAEQPQAIADLKALTGRGQVELLGGGYYAPLLTLLPDWDAQ